MSTPEPPKRRLRKSGGYRELRSFQITTLIYDGTVSFCKRFVSQYSRTVDQMVQAARSGRQNIAEGNRAAAVSSHSELKLTNVARASQEELLLDFEDYLRQNDLPLWPKDSAEASKVRLLGKKDPSDPTDLPTDTGDRARYKKYEPWLEHKDPTTCANTLICLIHQANFLLDQQLITMEQTFVKEGGYREQLASERLAYRKNPGEPTDPSDQKAPAPTCPDCNSPMAIRTARQGQSEGSQFWGCSNYPTCKKTQQI